MSKASKIIICIVTCLLVVSIPFINTVQSLEVKQVFKEKKDTLNNTYISQISNRKSITKTNTMNVFFMILPILLFILWMFIYSYIVLFLIMITIGPYSNPLTIREVIGILMYSIPLSILFELLFLINFIKNPIVIIENIIDLIKDVLKDTLSNRNMINKEILYFGIY